MNTRLIIRLLPQLVAVALCAAAIKSYYSGAGVDDLGWVLAPTRSLVGLITGVDFVFESGAGYMSADHSFLIAASCSGVNFMITAFVLLATGWMWKRSSGPGWLFLPMSAAAAYLTTLLANTVRISTAMQIRRIDPELIWLNPDQLHRFEGIVIYFGFLLLIFAAEEKVLSDSDGVRPRTRWRHWLLPLGVYYSTTIAVPLANAVLRGGFAKAEFWEHAGFVIVIPGLLLLLIVPVRMMMDRRPDLHIHSIK